MLGPLEVGHPLGVRAMLKWVNFEQINELEPLQEQPGSILGG